MPTRIVFMGSPEFALPSLSGLAEKYAVVGVVTQPDRPAGRKRQFTPPPVKVLAEQLGLPVLQPRRLNEPQAISQLKEWNPEAIVVVAFGQLLRPEVLELPPFGCINVHASLLPRWRGAAPIQAAILAGDAQTGITIMKMDAGLDTGPILSQESIPIQPDDTAGSLSERLAGLGARLLSETLPAYFAGEITPRPQPETGVTLAPKLDKQQGELDFTRPAVVLERQVRAFHPWPGAFTTANGQYLKIHRASIADLRTNHPGKPLIYGGKPAFETSEGVLVLDQVQPAGKQKMPGEEYLRGARRWFSAHPDSA
jgi:methionyl-tRNA formyltransferase